MRIQDQRKLRVHLGRRSEALHTRFKAFELQANSLLEWSQAGGHMFYTAHGLSHIRRVEDAYDWLLSDDDISQFSAGEAFCLLCATYCHDMFMIPRLPGDESRARREHATKAASELRRLQGQLGLSAPEATYIGEIIRGHHVEDINELMQDAVLGADQIRIRMLGACLSMADICHADESRAPPVVFEYLSIEEDSARHWKRHMQIAGINRSGDRISVSAISFSEDGKLAVEQYAAEIEKQLGRVSPYFRSALQPIAGVSLHIKELDSEFDQDLAFRADTSAILDMLVEGIYQKADVFVRELIQNALDATYVESARSRKNAIPYRPFLAVTELHDSEGRLVGVRVDDNGSGMDVSEIKDTLLWIGQSRNNKESIQQLLQETGKSLIANFGIGLLSCFRVADSIRIRTQKGSSGRSVEVSISGYGESIALNEVASDIAGTSVIVSIKDEFFDLDASMAVVHYCRMVTLAEVYSYETADVLEFELPRRDLFAEIAASGIRVESIPSDDSNIKIEGQGYYCMLSIPWEDDVDDIVNDEGYVDVLNDGIFVTNEPTSNWLPKSFGFCSGIINFAAKSIDLPVSRDAVVDNEKAQLRKNDLLEKSSLILSRIVSESRIAELRDKVAVVTTYIYRNYDEGQKRSILSEIGALVVHLHSGALTTLREIKTKRPSHVYVNYKEGSWVSQLAVIDGLQLYYKKDDLSAMQADLAQKGGYVVIDAARADKISGDVMTLKESEVINAYLSAANIEVVDIVEEVPFIGNLRSLGLPKELRTVLGKRVKFVETGIRGEKIGWDLGDEVWLNVSNPVVRNVYERIRSDNLNERQMLALTVLISLVDNEFDYALRLCARALS